MLRLVGALYLIYLGVRPVRRRFVKMKAALDAAIGAILLALGGALLLER